MEPADQVPEESCLGVDVAGREVGGVGLVARGAGAAERVAVGGPSSERRGAVYANFCEK